MLTAATFSVVPTRPEFADELAALETIIFPDIAASELFTPAQYRQHVSIFPEGQMTVLAQTDLGTRIVGATTTLRCRDVFDPPPAYYFPFIGEGWLTTHDPAGDWLYGIGVSVHPDFRGQGLARLIYDARRELVRRLNLRGELVAGLLPGYPRYRDQMTVQAYVDQVVAGKLNDPTLSVQLRMGFEVVKLMHGFIHDARSDDTTTLLRRLKA